VRERVGCERLLAGGVSQSRVVAAWALPLKLHIVVVIAAAVAVCLVAEAHGPRWLRGSAIPAQGSHG